MGSAFGNLSIFANKEVFIFNNGVVHNIFLSLLGLKALTKVQQLVREQEEVAGVSGLLESRQPTRLNLVKKQAAKIFQALTEQVVLRGYVPFGIVRSASLEPNSDHDPHIEDMIDVAAKGIDIDSVRSNLDEHQASPVILFQRVMNDGLMGAKCNSTVEFPGGGLPFWHSQIPSYGDDGSPCIPLVDSDGVSRFIKLGELGFGGYGRVTLFRDGLLHKLFALKETAFRGKYSEKNVERMVSEPRALALMNHGNVIRMYTAWFCRQPDMGVDTDSASDSDFEFSKDNDSDIPSVRQAPANRDNYGLNILPAVETTNEISTHSVHGSQKIAKKTTTCMSPRQVNTGEPDPPARYRTLAFVKNNDSTQIAANASANLPSRASSLSPIRLRRSVTRGCSTRHSPEKTWPSNHGIRAVPPCISVFYTMDYHPMNLEHFIFGHVRDDSRATLAFYFPDGRCPAFCGHLLPALDMLAGICDGLAHVHSHRIVHRDLKPANILISLHSVRPDSVSFVDLAACPDCAASIPPCSAVGALAGPAISTDSPYRYAVPHIADFGTARDAEDMGGAEDEKHSPYKAATACLPPPLPQHQQHHSRACIRGFPAVTRGYNAHDRRPTFRTDVFALGVICLEFLAGAMTSSERAAVREAGCLGGFAKQNRKDGVEKKKPKKKKQQQQQLGSDLEEKNNDSKDDYAHVVFGPVLDCEINCGIAAMCARDVGDRWDLEDVRVWIARLQVLHAREYPTIQIQHCTVYHKRKLPLRLNKSATRAAY